MIKTQLTIKKIALNLQNILKERYKLILIDKKINNLIVDIFELHSFNDESNSLFYTDLTVDHLANNIKALLKNKYQKKINFLNSRELLSNILGFKNANTMIGLIKKTHFFRSNDFFVGQYVMSSLHPELGIGRLIDISLSQSIFTVDFGYGIISDLFNDDISYIDIDLIDVGSKLENSVTAVISTDDGVGLSCEFDIRNYLKFLSFDDLNTLLDNNKNSDESDKVFDFFSSLGFLEIIDIYLDHKNSTDVNVGYSVAIDHESLNSFISSIS